MSYAPGTTPDPQPGDTLAGRYKIQRRLGGGGYGHVYAALDSVEQRSVAIKLLRQDADVHDPRAAARLKQESLILKNLDHPHIVKIFALEIEPPHTFLVMEHLEGRNMEQVIREEGPASSERVLAVTKQILDALEQAHDKHILHRDIKPENIILLAAHDAQGREISKLVDFGLAKPQESLRDSSDTGSGGATLVKTRGGGFLGTPRYTAPEQAVGDPLGPYTDLFNLALVVAEWLTGKLRLTGSTHAELMTLLLGPSPIHVDDCPPAWQPWLRKMLEKQPELRMQSAKQAADELSRIVQRSLHSPRTNEFEFDLEYGALVEATSSSSSSSSFLDDDGPLELDRDATHVTTLPPISNPQLSALPERSQPSLRAPMLSPPPSNTPLHGIPQLQPITGQHAALHHHLLSQREQAERAEPQTSPLTILAAALVSCIVFLILIAALGSAFKLF